MKINVFEQEMYPINLVIISSPIIEILNERFEYDDGSRILSDHLAYEAVVLDNIIDKTNNKYVIFLVFIKELTLKLICHEITHVTQLYWEFISEKQIGHEADAYLAGWVGNCVQNHFQIQLSYEKN